jgi:hypothetical protein
MLSFKLTVAFTFPALFRKCGDRYTPGFLTRQRHPHCQSQTTSRGWKKDVDAREQGALKAAEEAARKFQVSVSSKDLGDVPVLEITPKGWVDFRPP